MTTKSEVPKWHPASDAWLQDLATHPFGGIGGVLSVFVGCLFVSLLGPGWFVAFLFGALDDNDLPRILIAHILTASILLGFMQVHQWGERCRDYLEATSPGSPRGYYPPEA